MSDPGFWENLYGQGRDGWEFGAPGLLLVLFIIFLPAGIFGSAREFLVRRFGRTPAPAAS